MGKSIPRSLISGNELDETKKGNVDLLLRKKKKDHKFNELIIGNIEMVNKYYDSIEMLIDEYSLVSGDVIKEVAIHTPDE